MCHLLRYYTKYFPLGLELHHSTELACLTIGIIKNILDMEYMKEDFLLRDC